MSLSFVVKMDDKVSPAAGSAAHQVKVLSSAMAGLQNAMVRANAVGNDKAFGKAATAHAAMKSQVDSLKASIVPATPAMGSYKEAMKALRPYAAAAAVAVGVVTAAIVGFAKALVGVMQFVAERKALQGSLNALTADGKATMAMLDGLSQRLPFTTDEMGKWVKQMAAAGVKDLPRLAQATKAAAASSAIMGDATGQAGEKIVGLVTDINRAIQTRQGIGDLRGALEGTGITIDEVAKAAGVSVRQLNMMAASGRQLNKIGNVIQDALIQKGKPAMKDMMLTWDNLTKRFHDGMGQLMSGVADTPGFKSLVHSLQTIVMLFSGGTKSAGGMKSGMTFVFDAMFKGAARFVTYATIGFLSVRLAMSKFYLALWPTLHTLLNINRAVDKFAGKSSMWTGLVSVVQLLAKGMWNLARPFVYAAGIMVSFVGSMVWMWGAAKNVMAKVVTTIKAPFMKIAAWFKKIGKSIVDGLVDGIKGNTHNVGEVAAAMAKSAKDGAAKPLEIHSPSRVMRRMGKEVPAGFAGGIEDGAPKVRMASEGMAGNAAGGAARGSAGKVGGGVTVHVQAGAVVIHGAEQSMAAALEEGIADLFERIALTQGLGAGVG